MCPGAEAGRRGGRSRPPPEPERKDERACFPRVAAKTSSTYWRLLAHHHLALAKKPYEPEAPARETSIQVGPQPTPSLARFDVALFRARRDVTGPLSAPEGALVNSQGASAPGDRRASAMELLQPRWGDSESRIPPRKVDQNAPLSAFQGLRPWLLTKAPPGPGIRPHGVVITGSKQRNIKTGASGSYSLDSSWRKILTSPKRQQGTHHFT
jgi:hypothetical protein